MTKRRKRKIKKKAVTRLLVLLLIIISIIVLGISFLSTKNNNIGYEKLENEVTSLNTLINNNLINVNDLEIKYKTEITQDIELEKSVEKYLLDVVSIMKEYNDIKYSDDLIKSLTIKNIYNASNYYKNVKEEIKTIKNNLSKVDINNYYNSKNMNEFIKIVNMLEVNTFIKDMDNTLDNISFNEDIISFLENHECKISDKVIFNSDSVYNSFKELMAKKKDSYFIEIFDYDKVKEYYTEVIRNQNTVIVYELENNKPSKIAKVFPCSVGLNDGTPTGTFKTTDKYVWRALFGGVYGQYATRINGSILFHSVPYTSQSKSSLEWDEFNKLGTAASMGCVRMTVADVKWIYDNCAPGMTVKIYDGELPNGVVKPIAPKIDVNSPNKGWDPTDPDENNPYNK